jgi:hypothetical protein
MDPVQAAARSEKPRIALERDGGRLSMSYLSGGANSGGETRRSTTILEGSLFVIELCSLQRSDDPNGSPENVFST